MGSGLCKAGEKDLEAQHRILENKCLELRRKSVVVEGAAQELLTSYEKYSAAYADYAAASKGNEEGKPAEDTVGSEAQVVQLSQELAEQYDAYMHSVELSVFNPGDVVQVRDASSRLYFQAVVIGAHDDGTVDVEYSSEEEKVCSEFNVDPSRLRKVQRWDFLEVGDTVRVKVGHLQFQGVIAEIKDDGTVDVDFACHDNENEAHEEDAYEQIENHPRTAVTKLYSCRLPK